MQRKSTKRVRGKPFRPGCKGGPGRPPGKPNQVTADLRDVRREIIESWRTCEGPKLLSRLAELDPAAYLKIVCSVLPKDAADAARLPDIKIVVVADSSAAPRSLLPTPDPEPVKLLPVEPMPVAIAVPELESIRPADHRRQPGLNGIDWKRDLRDL